MSITVWQGALLIVVTQGLRLVEQRFSQILLEQRKNVGKHTLSPEASTWTWNMYHLPHISLSK